MQYDSTYTVPRVGKCRRQVGDSQEQGAEGETELLFNGTEFQLMQKRKF